MWSRIVSKYYFGLLQSNQILLLLATVRMLRIRFNSCAFVLVGSPNPWTCAEVPHPTVNKFVPRLDY